MSKVVEKKSVDPDLPEITVYADLNCPYCYALNERLENMGVAEAVNWLPVEHAPDLYKYNFTNVDKQQLINEVEDVLAKAPEIALKVPPTRPNSCQASKLLATIIEHHPEMSVVFRTTVYRALWQKGDDISDAKVLNNILVSIGLPDLEVPQNSEKQLLIWHKAWEQGYFARNIPSMESTAGFKLLGFPPLAQLKQFIKTGVAKVSDFKDASCVLSERYSIAVISNAADSWPQPGLLEAVSHYHYYSSVDSLCDISQPAEKLDMIIMNNPHNNVIENIRILKDFQLTQYVPIVLLTDNDDIQISAYRAGVSDIASYDINGEILGHKMVQILRTKRSGDKLFKISRIDFLTGLYNRREFDAAIEREWRQAHREKKTLSLLMIDIDSFKLFNDTYGHSMGDEVLRRFSQIIESCVNRPTDLAVRYGGEEFAVILPNVDIEGAKHVAELIRSQTEVHDIKHRTSPVKPHLTISIGVAEIGVSGEISISELIDNADRALYRAKEKGRNQVFSDASHNQ